MADKAITMAFPVEGWTHSAAVALRQLDDNTIEGEVDGGRRGAQAWQQALAVLSLDSDGSGYAQVGERDPVIGGAAAGARVPAAGAVPLAVRGRLRVHHRAPAAHRAGPGDPAADGRASSASPSTSTAPTVSAFPTPQRLREITEIPGVSDEKITRLHGVAEAAMAGRLDRARLRSLPVDEALAEVKTLRGVGDFFAVAHRDARCRAWSTPRPTIPSPAPASPTSTAWTSRRRRGRRPDHGRLATVPDVVFGAGPRLRAAEVSTRGMSAIARR